MTPTSEYNKAFAKHIPTAFIVESPFQLLCAWEAIGEFEIEDYCIVLVLERGNIRNEQTFAMLQERKMEYNLCYYDEIRKRLSKENEHRYARIMIGDYDDLGLLRMCGHYAAKGAIPVFMDDGLSSIMILRGEPYKHSKFVRMITGPIGLERARIEIFKQWEKMGLKNNNYFYTIYSNIKTRKFNIYPNSFSHLTEHFVQKQEEVVLVVGTVIDATAEEIGISTSLLEGIIWDRLVVIRKKYPKEHIIYIPHGRDYNEHIEQLCQCLGIEYKRLKMSIEYYVVSEGLNIKAIYGNTSTALSTLRIITNAPVVHWLIPDKYGEAWRLTKIYTKYYEQMGMQTDVLWMPQISLWAHIKNTIKKYTKIK